MLLAACHSCLQGMTSSLTQEAPTVSSTACLIIAALFNANLPTTRTHLCNMLPAGCHQLTSRALPTAGYPARSSLSTVSVLWK